MSTPIRQLLYSTRATGPITSGELRDVQRDAMRENYKVGITGFMLYGYGHFVHLLEGDPADVDAVYEQNVRETWHFGANILYDRTAPSRCVRSWSMGVLNLECEPTPDWTADCRQLIEACLESPKINMDIRDTIREHADRFIVTDQSTC